MSPRVVTRDAIIENLSVINDLCCGQEAQNHSNNKQLNSLEVSFDSLIHGHSASSFRLSSRVWIAGGGEANDGRAEVSVAKPEKHLRCRITSTHPGLVFAALISLSLSLHSLSHATQFHLPHSLSRSLHNTLAILSFLSFAP